MNRPLAKHIIYVLEDDTAMILSGPVAYQYEVEINRLMNIALQQTRYTTEFQWGLIKNASILIEGDDNGQLRTGKYKDDKQAEVNIIDNQFLRKLGINPFETDDSKGQNKC